MKKNLFEILGEDGKKFRCNPENGKWIIGEGELPEYLNQKLVFEPFCGTSMIVANISQMCPLDCVYCFAKKSRGDKKMSVLTGKKMIDRVFELSEAERNLVFHGNEPMTNYSLIKELILYSKPKGKINFRMQTNAILLDEEKIRFLTENNVGIGISLDGLSNHQNYNRPFFQDFDLSNSYEKVLENINILKNFQPEIPLIAVITKNNVNDLENILHHFENLGISSVYFNPAYPSKDKDYSPEISELEENMKKVLDNHIENILMGDSKIKITNLRDLFRTFFTTRNTYSCIRCSGTKIHPLLGVGIQGEIYPCDLFWDQENYKIGNIFDNSFIESFNSPKNMRINRDFQKMESCLDCNWKTFCGGECPGSAQMLFEDIHQSGPYCEYRKFMLEYAAKKISFLHEKNILKKILEI